MSETYTVTTHSTLLNSGATWSVTLEDEEHMLNYQVYANTLVAAVVAKLGEYALELAGDPNALKKGGAALAKTIAEA